MSPPSLRCCTGRWDAQSDRCPDLRQSSESGDLGAPIPAGMAQYSMGLIKGMAFRVMGWIQIPVTSWRCGLYTKPVL